MVVENETILFQAPSPCFTWSFDQLLLVTPFRLDSIRNYSIHFFFPIDSRMVLFALILRCITHLFHLYILVSPTVRIPPRHPRWFI